MSGTPAGRADVAVVGLGYIGLVIAVALARAGVRVVGVERHADVRDAVRRAHPQFYEPGLAEAMAALPPDRLQVRESLAGVAASAVIVCVGTGYDGERDVADLSDLRVAVDMALPAITADTLVVVRSTVPVGTCRGVVLPALRETAVAPLLAFCPERTIQGRALAEITSLPQVIGARDELSGKRAAELFGTLSQRVVPVSSLETAEFVKLVCNAHTDVLYGFGNEVAFMAGALGLDALEVIEAANRGYPRPDIARPGYVGGSCLVKDPYLLALASRDAGYEPRIILGARAVNERVPRYVVDRLVAGLGERDVPLPAANVLVCGITYKGEPLTDDVRGAASLVVREALAGRVGVLAGHDPMLDAEAIARAGFVPAGLDDGIKHAHAIAILTNHPDYRALDLAAMGGCTRSRPLVVDVWGMLDPLAAAREGVEYLRFGGG
jgi:UDP-N-acetyl-D-mannosaminuronic acid dehydrogenase